MIELGRQRFRTGALQELMREKGLSVTGMARKLRVTRQAVGSYLAGVTTPQFATVLRMAEVFGKPLDYFVEKEP